MKNFQKTKMKALFLGKENVSKTMESVPKWNDEEHILLVLKRFPSILEGFLFFQISLIFGHIVDYQRINH